MPGFRGGGHVDEREQNASDNLKQENHESSAAENIEPARGFAWNGMLCSFTDGAAKLQARIHPFGAD